MPQYRASGWALSTDARLILDVIPPGSCRTLDLGGGNGILRSSLEDRGHRYINLDIRRFANGEPSLIGEAHRLPFKDGIFDIVISKDSFSYFRNPWVVVKEVNRVLRENGKFIILVAFMHPLAGNEFYRYTPLGLRHLLNDFDVSSLDAPLWMFTVFGTAAIDALKRIGLGLLGRPVRRFCQGLDRLSTAGRVQPLSFAAAYRVVARKPSGIEK